MEASTVKDEMLQFFMQLNSDEQQSLLNMVKTLLKTGQSNTMKTFIL